MLREKSIVLAVISTVACMAGCTLESLECSEFDAAQNCPETTVCIDHKCRQAKEGEPCKRHDQCEEKSLICHEGKCSVGLRCATKKNCNDDEACIDEICKKVGIGDRCQDDTMCPGELKCINEQCLPGSRCETKQDCNVDEVCVQTLCQKTIAGDACTKDKECSGTMVCVDNICGKLCQKNEDCNASQEICSGYTCKATKQGDQCASHDDCAGEWLCIHQKCTHGTPCQVKDDCRDNQMCYEGLCVDGGVGAECIDDAMCIDSMICLDGHCAKERRCSVDKDCINLQQCGKKGLCYNKIERQGACKSAADCEESQLCIDNTCTRFVKRGCSKERRDTVSCLAESIIEYCDQKGDNTILYCGASNRCYAHNENAFTAFCGAKCQSGDNGLSICSQDLNAKIECVAKPNSPITHKITDCKKTGETARCSNANIENEPGKAECLISDGCVDRTFRCNKSAGETYTNICLHQSWVQLDKCNNGCSQGACSCSQYFESSWNAGTQPWDLKLCRDNDVNSHSYRYYRVYEDSIGSHPLRDKLRAVIEAYPGFRQCATSDTACNSRYKEKYERYKGVLAKHLIENAGVAMCRPGIDYYLKQEKYGQTALEACEALHTPSSANEKLYAKAYTEACENLPLDKTKMIDCTTPPALSAYSVVPVGGHEISDGGKFVCHSGKLLYSGGEQKDGLRRYVYYPNCKDAEEYLVYGKYKCLADMPSFYYTNAINMYIDKLQTMPVTCQQGTCPFVTLDEGDGTSTFIGLCPSETVIKGCKTGEKALLESLECIPKA